MTQVIYSLRSLGAYINARFDLDVLINQCVINIKGGGFVGKCYLVCNGLTIEAQFEYSYSQNNLSLQYQTPYFNNVDLDELYGFMQVWMEIQASFLNDPSTKVKYLF